MLSHHHRTIFVHVPKCAGQSVETAYLADLGLAWETRAPLLLRFNDRPELGPPRLAHLTAAQYVSCRYAPQEMFDAYFKFAIVRNPWSRTVSLYRHIDLNMPFAAFVRDWLAPRLAGGEEADQRWFVRPQTEFVRDGDRLLVDRIVRFEALGAAFAEIAAASGLKTPLPHVNRGGIARHERTADTPRKTGGIRRLRRKLEKALTPDRRSGHEAWQAYYDTETRRAVGELYAADVDAFGYGFDD